MLEPEVAFADGDETVVTVTGKVAGEDGKADVVADGTPLPDDARAEPALSEKCLCDAFAAMSEPMQSLSLSALATLYACTWDQPRRI